MGEATIKAIERLQSLAEDSHWFCPRQDAQDGNFYYPEDIQARAPNEKLSDGIIEKRIDEAESRKKSVLQAFRIFAFNGKDATPYQEWLERSLASQLQQCEICVREYYRNREELRQTLLEERFDEEEIRSFLEVIDDLNRRRVKQGLQSATKTLQELPPERRWIASLPPADLYAIFEVLNSHIALKDLEFLSSFFDQPFRLVQEKKTLRLGNYTPAMTYFLFHQNEDRRRWAHMSWARFKRNITATEFEWNVKAPLHNAMGRVQLNDLEKSFLPLFWAGVHSIVERLDQDLITHSLRAMEHDVCKLALDHLQVDSTNSFREILASVNRILVVSPVDFWEAMGSIPPSTWIEQFFNSAALKRFISPARVSKADDRELLQELFSWIVPFVTSIRAVNQPVVCRSLVGKLFERFQTDKDSLLVREYTFRIGLEVLSSTLRTLANSDRIAGGQASALEVLDIVCEHFDKIASSALEDDSASQNSRSVIRWAIGLDCKCIAEEKDLLSKDRQLPQTNPYGGQQRLWTSLIKKLDKPGGIELAQAAILGVRELIGVEPFVVKKDATMPKIIQAWNDVFTHTNETIALLLERINEYSPEDIQNKFFDDEEATNAFFGNLFSSDEGVRNATVEILKTVSGQTVRQEALADAVRPYFFSVLNAFSWAFRRIAAKKPFAPAITMLKIAKDLMEILCNSTDGVLRSKQMDQKDKDAAENFWQAMWHELATIFRTTEEWSYMGHEKSLMVQFVADVIEFARFAFDQIAVFTGALSGVNEGHDEKRTIEDRLIREPKTSMDVMVKWLRLRDEVLLSKATELICNLLKRLRGLETRASESALFYIEDILMSKVKTVLNNNRKAELQSALETHLGTTVAAEVTNIKEEVKEMEKVKARKGNTTIDLTEWASKAQKLSTQPSEGLKRALAATSKGGAEALKHHQALQQGKTLIQSLTRPPAQTSSRPGGEDFKKQREAELIAKKKRDLEAAAAARRRATGKNLNEGSGVRGIGNYAKDQSRPKGESIMVDDEESDDDDDEDDMDDELFGPSSKGQKKAIGSTEYDEARARAWAKEKARAPVKKQRIARTAQDMRARLAPNLSSLHEALLRWDFFHDGTFPPRSGPRDYSEVLKDFRDPLTYQKTFEPLLILEAWNGFLKAREELQNKPFEIKIVNRSSVDAFFEVSSAASLVDGKELSEGDVVLLSKASAPATSPDDPHCLARIHRMARKKGHVEVLYRIVPGSQLIPHLTPDSTVTGLKVMSIVPLEREYGALKGLEYYDLCEEVVRGKPSPLLHYGDGKLKPLINTYDVNNAQAKAIQSAIDNDAFTLIQGPPGSGKTKTIVAIVGALLTQSLRGTPNIPNAQAATGRGVPGAAPPKKLLVCAPSNAAVDELVMRFKAGIKTTNGEDRKVSVVRLGRSDAINANVQDVTLDELVNKKLNVGPAENNAFEETQKIMSEHQSVSAQLREARASLDAAEAEKKETSELTKLRKDVDDLRRSKNLLSQRIDSAKDAEKMQSQQAEAGRRKAQQEVIQAAHVICATLSGSGHDMFQNLNVEFETVIIDEAAQCVELSALIPLKYGCAKCILVGDPQQLPPTVFSKEAARFKYEQSLFVRMQANQPQDVHLLDTQYRMHPDISAFPRQAFYENRLVDGPKMAQLRTRAWHATELLTPYRFFGVQGQHESATRGHSLINKAEIRIAIQLYRRLTTDFGDYDFTGKIGVITPYKSQLRELKDQFRHEFGPSIGNNIEFNTTDAFQGRESEVIIFSCVRASPAGGIGFLQDIRRMNVGLTRAKSSLWVLGNSQSLEKGEYWSKLIKHSRSSGNYTEGDLKKLLSQPSRRVRDLKASNEKAEARQTGDSSDAMDVDEPAERDHTEHTKPTTPDDAGPNKKTTTASKTKLAADAAERKRTDSKSALKRKNSETSTAGPNKRPSAAPSSSESETSGSSESDDDDDEDEDVKMRDATSKRPLKPPPPPPGVKSVQPQVKPQPPKPVSKPRRPRPSAEQSMFMHRADKK